MEAWIRRDVVEADKKLDEFTHLASSRLMPSFTFNGFDLIDFKSLHPDLWREMRELYAIKARTRICPIPP